MQKTLLASVIVLALSACDGESGVSLVSDPVVAGNGPTVNETVPTQEAEDTDTGSDDNASGGPVTDGPIDDEPVDDGSYDDKDDDKDYDDGKNYDDNDNGDDHDVKDDLPNDDQPDDDSGSSTSDGGEPNDDSGSSTSDGGEPNDDSGSSTSDGGEPDDDSGSSTSDGGEPDDDSGSSTSDGGDDSDGGSNDGGDFESEQVGGSVIRTSSLASSSQENICTIASDQENFSDTQVGDFILHNNAWRPWRAFPDYQWEQCIYTNTNGAVVGWNYDWGPGQTGINGSPNASGDYYVRSYPELIYGVKDEYRTSAPQSETGFPVRLGDMPNISIDYAYDGPQYGEPRIVDASNNSRYPNGTTISGERNVAIESFLYNADDQGNCSTGIVSRDGGSNHVYEIMVWLDAGAERLPAGPSDFVADVSIRGEAFKVYTKGADPRYIAFVSQNPQTSGTLIWNDFTDWSKTYAHRVEQEFGAQSNSDEIQDDWCVANIIVGTEIFWGAGNLDIYDWTITQRQP